MSPPPPSDDNADDPPVPHLEGSDVRAGDDPDVVPDRHLVDMPATVWMVEEALDGTHVGPSFDRSGTRCLRSRGAILDVDGRPRAERPFDDLETWARVHEAALLERLEDRYAVHGAWMGALRTQLHDAPPSLLMECDVQDRREGTFLSTRAHDALLEGLPLPPVPVPHEGEFPTIGQRRR